MPSWPNHDDLAAQITRESEDAAGRLRLAIDAGRRLTDLSDDLVERFVGEARGAGLSWAEIGDLFGTSKQAAQKRYAAPAGAGGWPSLTLLAQEAMNRAGAEAERLGHNYVGTEHVLLGLLDTKPAEAAQILGQF